MDINYFREFVSLAGTKSYAETAEAFFIAQSTLSKHIKNFELELGQALFRRTSRKVELTEFGREFLPYAERIVKVQAEYTDDLLRRYNASNQLSIGVISPLFRHIRSDVIQRFKDDFPQYQVVLEEQDTGELKRDLLKKKYDVIFIHNVVKDTATEYSKVLFETDRLVAVLPHDHPLTEKDSVTINDLKDFVFLLMQKGSPLYRLCIAECRKVGFEPRIEFTSPSCENLFYMVEKKHGISIVAKKFLPAHDNVCLVDIEPPITTEINACYVENDLSPAAAAFLQWLKTEY